jgi:hypothetical protein
VFRAFALKSFNAIQPSQEYDANISETLTLAQKERFAPAEEAQKGRSRSQ